MDRQSHDFAAASAMAYAQQQQQQGPNIPPQQQFGFHPQHQQFPPPSVHGPPFLPTHPPLQRFPYPHPIQQQPQLHPHPPPHPHLLNLQPQQQQPQPSPGFGSNLPPRMGSPFTGQYDSTPPPSDPELQKRIDKLVEYIVKNGPEFEALIRDKQKNDPGYGFLFGGEGNAYYRYKLWICTHPPGGPPFSSAFQSTMMQHPPNPMMNPPLNAPPMTAPVGAPHLHQTPFPPFHEQQQHHQHPQPFVVPGRPDYDQSSKSFRGLSGPLPSDIAIEFNNVVNNLNGTKESIKGAKVWFMQRSPFAPALAEALRDRIFNLDDFERQMHIIYLANDILFDSLQRRSNPRDLDNEAHAFKPVLGSMLARIYYNPQNKEENQSRLQKIVQFWATKEVYDQETIHTFEAEMKGGVPSIPADSGMMANQRQPDNPSSVPSLLLGQEHFDRQIPLSVPPNLANQQFLPSSVPGGFPVSVPLNSSVPPANPPLTSQLSATPVQGIGEKVPPYPLFPPGLIPGMVRKMQIGSGVPYSPMSPLDIPTVIPPSNVSSSETLEKVSKFFKEIGEVNPSEGPIESDSRDEDYDQYEREPTARKGGTCIPPPPSLNVDPESGTYADGSVERKPGSGGSGRLGLGATANPNEVTQYDDVYTSYRKQRSTNYHSSMNARAGAR